MADEGIGHDQVLAQATEMLHERFEIRHAALQPESEAYAAKCPTACGCQGLRLDSKQSDRADKEWW